MKALFCLILSLLTVGGVCHSAGAADSRLRLIFHLDFNTIQMNRATVECLLEHVAGAGYDAILWEIENKVRWESCPGAVSPDAFSKDEFRAILAKAKALGLEPIPLMQTFGHGEYVLDCDEYRHLREDPKRKDCYCPLNPGTVAFQKALLGEYLDLFGPDLKRFHLGGDEAFAFGTCGKCRERDRLELYLSHLETMAGELRRRKIRPGVWQDMLHKFDAGFSGLARLPKDFTLWYWEYFHEPNDIWRCWGEKEELAIRREAAAGREIFFCASTQCVKEDPFTVRFAERVGNVYDGVEICRRDALAGVCVTSWSVHQGSKELQFPLIDYAAKRLFDPGRDGATDWWTVAARYFGDVPCDVMADLTAWNYSLGEADGRSHGFKDAAVPGPDFLDKVSNVTNRLRLARLARDGVRRTEAALKSIADRPESERTDFVRLAVEAGTLKVAYLSALAKKLSGEPVGEIPFERTVRFYAREQSPYSAERSARRIWTPVADEGSLK